MENYQACSKIATLEGNILAAFMYQLKMLHKLSLQSSANCLTAEVSCETIEPITKITARNIKDLSQNIKKNTELFNRQAEKNLVESLEDSVARNWMKIPTSKSLNNLQAFAQELYSFDCQGGLEELCKKRKNNDLSSNMNAKYFDTEFNVKQDEQQEWIEELIFNKNDVLSQCKSFTHNSAQNLTRSTGTETILHINDNQTDQYDIYREETVLSDKMSSHFQRNYVINETIKALRYYLSNINKETNTVKCMILQRAINFWVEHNFPIQSLEDVFLEHIPIIYYPLGILLF